jgi:hypothetical protein
MTSARSYLDPVYDRFEQSAAHQTGVDPALLRAIRTQGERSNSDQVSTTLLFWNTRLREALVVSHRAGRTTRR